MLSSPLFLITFVVSCIVAVGIWSTYFRNKIPKGFATTLHLFTRQMAMLPTQVENRNGLMFPEVGPGFVEVKGTAILRRFGRVWKSCVTQQEEEAARNRVVVYITRENDPNPLNISLGKDKGYQSEQIDDATFNDLANLNQREAAGVATSEGSTKDALLNKLMIALIIAVAGAIASWATFFVLTIVKGG